MNKVSTVGSSVSGTHRLTCSDMRLYELLLGQDLRLNDFLNVQMV